MRRRRLAVDDDRQAELGRERGDAVDEIGGDDQHASAAVGQAVAQRVGPEELAERQRDGAGLGDREVRDRGREALRHEQPDALAARDPERAERVREPVRRLGQLAERPDPVRAAGVVLDHRRIVRDLLVRAGDADVEALRDPPAEGGDDLLVRPAGRHDRRPHGSHVRGWSRARPAPSATARGSPREERHEDVRQRADRHQVGERDDADRAAERASRGAAPTPR